MFVFNRQLAIARIKKKQPLIEGNELKFELIKECYSQELSPEFLEGIKEKLIPIAN